MSDVDELDNIAQWLVDWNDAHAVPEHIRILKLSEEVGEVAEAYLGMTGTNPRKGQTHDIEDVRSELADVALAALVAIASLNGNPMAELAERARFVKQRLEGVEPAKSLELVTDGCPPAVTTVKTPKRGTRVTENFTPSEVAIQRIRNEFPWMQSSHLEAEHRKFIDYWLSKAGKDAVKIDWDRTWCNWMRTAAERMPRTVSAGPSRVDSKAASYLED